MKRLKYLTLAALAFMSTTRWVPAFAANSVNYSLVPTTVDGGGGLAASASYTLQSSISLGGGSFAANYSLLAGYGASLSEPMTDVLLSSNSVPENEPSGSAVGILSIIGGQSGAISFSLVSGIGAEDNNAFAISGSTLRTAAVFNYEARTSYSVRIRAVDPAGGSYEKVFSVNIVDVPEAPISFALNSAVGFTNGQFRFSVTGDNGTVVVIYGSTNLVNWVPLATNNITDGTLTFSDPRSSTNKDSFYQLRGQ